MRWPVLVDEMLKFVCFGHTLMDIQMKLEMLHWPFLYHTSVNSKVDEGKNLKSVCVILELFVVISVYC